MSQRSPAECANMDEVRAEIDCIDQALIDLIAERFGYVNRAAELKNSAQEALVSWRIEQVVENVRARATEAGAPPELAEILWRQMIDWFVRYEEERLGRAMDGAGQG